MPDEKDLSVTLSAAIIQAAGVQHRLVTALEWYDKWGTGEHKPEAIKKARAIALKAINEGCELLPRLEELMVLCEVELERMRNGGLN